MLALEMSVFRAVVCSAALAVATAAPVSAMVQEQPEVLFQLEVTDTTGLPLPDAKLELFTYVEGGIVREWIAIAPRDLPPGMHLLRFSHDGYRTSMFSVPLQKGGRTSLRVRLIPDGAASTATAPVAQAAEVRAIGLVLAGGAAVDFLGDRRVVDRAAIEATERTSLPDILRRVRGSGALVMPQSNGRYIVRIGKRGLCGIVVDGKPNRVTAFEEYDQFHAGSQPEAIELVERGQAIPFAFRPPRRSDCAMLLVWLRGR